MTIETIVLPCKRITDAARAELHRAGQTIHRGLLWGELKDVEIVELHHFGDANMMFVWDWPREIQIPSLQLYLFYQWSDEADGYELLLYDEAEPVLVKTSGEADDLGDLDEHPF